MTSTNPRRPPAALLLAVPLALSLGVGSACTTGHSDAPASDDSGTTLAPGSMPSGTIAVGSLQSVVFYPPGAVTGTAPTGQLQFTGARYAAGLAFDARGYFYLAGVPDAASIAVYAPGSVGSAAPVRTISGSKTGLQIAGGLVVDAKGLLYVGNDVTQSTTLADDGGVVTGPGPSSVAVFAADADGDVAPVRTITLPADAAWSPLGMAMNAQGALFVGDSAAAKVYVFAPGASGESAPVETFGGYPGIGGVSGVALDSSGETLIADPVRNQIDTFGAGADDAGPPTSVLAGQQTAITRPNGVAVDLTGRILVTNENVGLTVFPPEATADVAPIANLPPYDADCVAVLP